MFREFEMLEDKAKRTVQLKQSILDRAMNVDVAGVLNKLTQAEVRARPSHLTYQCS